MLNKISITFIPNAALLLFVQIASTVVIISSAAMFSAQKVVFIPSPRMIKAYSSVAALFLATIYSNFRLIHAVGVNPFIVLRCTTPLIVSVLDWCFLGRELPDRRSIIALAGIFISGSAFTLPKLTLFGDWESLRHSDLSGVFWALVWLSCFALDMIYIKHIVDSYPCNGLERTLYQNALSLPILTLILISPLETAGVSSLHAAATEYAQVALILSCVAGTILSFTGMTLRSELSATVFTILGIVCKMASAFLNELFVEAEDSVYSFACIFLSIISSSMYRQAPIKLEVAPRQRIQC